MVVAALHSPAFPRGLTNISRLLNLVLVAATNPSPSPILPLLAALHPPATITPEALQDLKDSRGSVSQRPSLDLESAGNTVTTLPKAAAVKTGTLGCCVWGGGKHCWLWSRSQQCLSGAASKCDIARRHI